MKKILYLIAVIGLMFASCTKPENPNPNEEKTYSFSIGADKENDSTDETRVEMVDGLMHWSVGDEVGMYIWAGNTNMGHPNVVNNMRMTGLHNQSARTTTFKGELTQSQMEALSKQYLQDVTYHHCVTYYPYYPHNNSYGPKIEATNGTIIGSVLQEYPMTMHHTFPTSIKLPKNEFPMDNIIMFDYAKNAPRMTWLDDNGQQQWGERKTFKYKHTLAYLRIKIGENLSRFTFTYIIMGSRYTGSSNFYFSGKFYHNVETNEYIPYSNEAQNRIYISIDEGLNTGDYIYVPIPAYDYVAVHDYLYPNNRSLYFTIYNRPNSSNYTQKTISLSQLGITRFEPGKIYDITLNIPAI